jgi:hypothetical protein
MNRHDIEKDVSFSITGFKMFEIYKSNEYVDKSVSI